MIILEIMFMVFMLVLATVIIEVVSNSIFGKSAIITTLNTVKSVWYKLFKKKTAYTMLKEIQRQTEKYNDKYSVWNHKVSKFQIHYYYEVEKIINFLENTNDEVMAEFNCTYNETVGTIYRLMKETEFIISKKHHGELLALLEEMKQDVKDIHDITNSTKVVENSKLVSIEMEYVKLQRKKRQAMKG